MIETLRTSDDVLILKILVDLKMENADRFYDALVKHNCANQGQVILDFSSLRYLDSCSIGIFLKYDKYIRSRGGRIYLYGLSKSLQTVFSLAGLLNIFPCIDKAEANENYPELIIDSNN